MELEFKKTSLPYLKCILQDVRYQEETGEMIVPDSEPDIESVITSYADAVIRGKDCRSGCVVVSGGIKGSIIYRPEDHSGPKDLQFYLPFTVKFENAALSEQAKVICKVNVRNADGRMLNSRKAMLRVNISCSISVMQEQEEILFEPISLPNTMQIRESTYSVCQPVESSEKAFVVSETLEFPQSRPPIVRVLKESCRLEMSENKLVANKGVFKGLASFKFLYLSEDSNLYTHEQQIPFSQYCEFINEYNEQEMDVIPVVTGYDLSVDNVSPVQSAQLSIHILVQCIVYDDRSVQIIEDAFCIGEDLLPQWQSYHLDCQLDNQQECCRMRCQFHDNVAQIIDADIYVDAPIIERKNDNVCVTVHTIVQILAMNENGEIFCLQEKAQNIQEVALSEQGSCAAWAEMIGSVTTSLFTGGVDVHYELYKKKRFYSRQIIRTLCGGEVRVSEANTSRRPSVVIKRVKKDTDLWNIAKENQARIGNICEANKLQDSVIEEDRILLIPVG